MPAELVAYPLLLASTYAIYRVGRTPATPRAFEWFRLCVLAAFLGLIMALQVRYVGQGALQSPVALMGSVLAISGEVGLVGLTSLGLYDSLPHAPRDGGSQPA